MTKSIPPAISSAAEQFGADTFGARLLVTTAVVKGVVNLHYVAGPLWHIESELAEDTRQALFRTSNTDIQYMCDIVFP